ncbi:MAG: hypothetical protein WC356_01540 [Candidatus Micrarchaeia archaeon]|jgi:hypothetical protein
MIRNLTPRPAEKGKIKIGGLGEERKKRDGQGTYMLPVKYDHFEIVTTQRDAAGRFIKDTALMDRLMQAQGAQKLLEIPIRLLFDDPDLNFFTRYAAYGGKSIWCSGDGVEAERIGQDGKFSSIPCPCEHLEAGYTGQPKCKPWGSLRCLVEGVDSVGGIWSFKTTSWNTVNAILSSMALIKAITGGPLSGIPLRMVLAPKTVSTPDGKSMVAYIVSLEYRGPEEKLAELGYEIARRRVEHQIRMDTIEVEARKLLVAPHQESAEEQEATAAEFYPDPAEVEEGKKPAAQEPRNGKKKAQATQPTTSNPVPQTEAESQAQEPRNGGGQEAKSTDQSTTLKPAALTLPELMDLAKKDNACVDLPVPLQTSKGVHIGRWLEWGLNIREEMMITIELVPNLPQVSNGLTADMIAKSFKEAGINLAIHVAMAEQEGQERIAGGITSPEDALAMGKEATAAAIHGGQSSAAIPKDKGNGKEARRSLF